MLLHYDTSNLLPQSSLRTASESSVLVALRVPSNKVWRAVLVLSKPSPLICEVSLVLSQVSLLSKHPQHEHPSLEARTRQCLSGDAFHSDISHTDISPFCTMLLVWEDFLLATFCSFFDAGDSALLFCCTREGDSFLVGDFRVVFKSVGGSRDYWLLQQTNLKESN